MAEKPSYEELERRVRELELEASQWNQAKEGLVKTGKRLSQIIEGSPIPTFVINADHVVTYCNKAYENLRGMPASDLIGTDRQWTSFYSSKRPVLADLIVDNAPEEEFERLYGGKYRKSSVVEGAYEAEDFFPALGEKGRWVFFTAAPLKDSNGRIIGAIETLQDITERKEAEQARRKAAKRLRILLDFVPYPMVVFTVDGRVYYVNPAFTQTFGWTLEELEGKTIPYVPPDIEEQTKREIKRLFEERRVIRFETRRLTKDGRTLDVVIRAAVYSEFEKDPAGELVILRDITQEKRMARNNEAILRISMALPEHPDLEDLLDYITSEVKHLLGSEGSLVTLLDEEKQELFFIGASYDDASTQERIKDIRFSLDELVAGQVIKTGKPIIVNDPSDNPELHMKRDQKLGYRTRNLLLVPLKSIDRIIGVLCAINKKEGSFDQTDLELLNMIAGPIALSIENARFSEELKTAYMEVSSLNRAKDKAINHLSHELKTPVSVLSGSLNILKRTLDQLPERSWAPSMERAQRNLERIVDIQDEVNDIMRGREHRAYDVFSILLQECTDQLETIAAEKLGEGELTRHIRQCVEETFAPREEVYDRIVMKDFVEQRLKELEPFFPHREVKITPRLEDTLPVCMPADAMQKIVDGLLKNAVENTPDEGSIEVRARGRDEGVELSVQDWGVGITEEAQRRIFEGFFSTQDTMAYSSKKPFDFDAGGKGADLLRMKIFSERYNFSIELVSSRCRFIPSPEDKCPGRISDCKFCNTKEDCYLSGGTTFTLVFPYSGSA